MDTTLNPTPPLRTQRTRLGCLFAFLTPFFAGGVAALWIGFQKAQAGNTREGLVGMGVGAVFVVFAMAFLAFGNREHRKNAAQVQFEEEHPNSPWLWRPEWREGRLQSNEGKTAVVLSLMAAAFITLSLPAVLAFPKELAKDNKPILLALIFPLAGIGLGVGAARALVRRRKFGRTELELHTLPGVLGGTLSGAVHIPSKVTPDKGFNVRLLCLRRTTSGSGKNRSTRESVLWEKQKTILKEFQTGDPEHTGLPVFFNVPFDQPESCAGNPAIVWRLEVTADVPGVDYSAQFDVPVFKTSESRPDASPVADPTASFQPAPETWSPPAHSRIRVHDLPGGQTELRFPAARNMGVTFGLLTFLSIWTGIIWFMIRKEAPLVFPIVFGVFDLLLMVGAFRMLFHAVRVTADRSGLRIRHRLLLLTWTHTVDRADVDAIKLRIGMQSGTHAFYDLLVHTRAGRKFYAGTRIPDKKHAEWLVTQLGKAMDVAV